MSIDILRQVKSEKSEKIVIPLTDQTTYGPETQAAAIFP